jgi:hypothetical protein
MKKISVLLLSIVSSLSMAVSMHPCTPTQPGKPVRIFCQTQKFNVSIVVNYLMSPASALCTGQNYYERRSASVTITNKSSNKVVDAADIPHELFSYTLSPKVTFISEDPYLKLDKCIAPLAR